APGHVPWGLAVRPSSRYRPWTNVCRPHADRGEGFVMSSPDALSAPEMTRMRRRAIIAAAVGTSIEWYDFFLYTTVAALVLPTLFFPTANPLNGVLLAFSTNFVGFAARPVGAAIFGHFGDRLGRKATLIATLLVMGIGTVLIGVLPTYAQIGVWG